jgi:hypothetical protein
MAMRYGKSQICIIWHHLIDRCAEHKRTIPIAIIGALACLTEACQQIPTGAFSALVADRPMEFLVTVWTVHF